jgi:hypothetical protein
MEQELKQKQIEEMPVQCTDGRFEVIKEIQDYMLSATNMTEEEAYSFAFSCWQCNFKKIPEGAVVLTEEEYERWQGQTLNIKKVRKETAEKFAERVKMAFYYHFDEIIPSIMADKIDEICKEITEGKV